MIAQALEHDGPALVEVLVSRQELSMPPTITFEQAKGFGLFMLTAVLSGRSPGRLRIAKSTFRNPSSLAAISSCYSWPTVCMICPISMALLDGISWRDIAN
jgi:hypothetical protein